MNTFRTSFPIIALLLFALAPLFQSCLNDNDDNLFLAIATYHTADHGDVYFVLDDGARMFAGSQNVGNLEEGQRAYLYFYTLDEPMTGYEYNIRLRDIQPILTKSPFVMTEETVDSIGNDRINITNMWFGDGFLNIQFRFLGTRYPSVLHMINLVYNETEGSGEADEEGYITLEFRHNAYDDHPLEVLNGIVAFKGPFVQEGMKGLKIGYKSIYEEMKYVKIDFESKTVRTEEATDNESYGVIK